MGTIKGSDLYPGAPFAAKGDPTSLQAASGRVGEAPYSPVVWFFGGLALLVVLRVVYEIAPASARVG